MPLVRTFLRNMHYSLKTSNIPYDLSSAFFPIQIMTGQSQHASSKQSSIPLEIYLELDLVIKM